MKHLFLCISFILLLSHLYGQTNDEVISSSTDLQYDNTVGVSSSLRQLQTAADDGIRYNRYFAECILAHQQNGSLGLGCNLAFVPYRIGGYATGTLYNSLSMLTGGLVARPLAGLVRFDWQLYGGVAYADGMGKTIARPVGFEVGTRFSTRHNANYGNFAWWSVSLSRLYVNKRAYYTIGLSINLATMFGVWLVL